MRLAPIQLTGTFVLGSLLAPQSAISAEARLQIQLPSASPRPYVAIWLENATDHSFVGNLAVWYDTSKRGNRGAKWLADLREWWRKSGGAMSLAADGVTGATRGAGQHTINIVPPGGIARLQAGSYEVVIEVAREHGGSDLLRLPFAWPPKGAREATAQGRQEIGTARLTIVP